MQARDQDEWDDRDVQSQTEIEAKIELRDSNKAAETTRIEQQQAAAQQQPVTNATQQNNSTVPVTGASRDEYTKIANERVIPGQPLSRDQLNVIGLSLASGNTYSPEITAQYRSQRPDGIGVPFIPPPSSQNPVTSSTGTTNATTPASQNDPSATYVSARTFADPAVQKEYDGFMRQQPSSSWNNASVQNDAAAFANAAVGEQAFQAENGSPARVAASQTAGDAVANTNGTTGGSQPVTPGQLDAEQQKILAILNANRVKQGLDPLDATSAEAANDIAELQQRRAALLAGDKNTGTSTGDFIEADALSSAEAAKVEQKEGADVTNNTVTTDAPKLKEGWSNDGKGFAVNMSGTRDPGTKTPTTIGGSAPVQVKSVDNPLHDYPDYTYSLSLHVLNPASYKKLVDSPSTPFKPTVTLVSSANKYSKSPPRDQAFIDDFYFDGLKMTTVIGLGHSSRGTNVNDLSFTLIEPYGMTLLNRLLDINVRLGHKNYLDVPYLLEINFFGYDDKGMFAKLENHSKYIPIRFVTMKIKAGTKGSEYAFTAIPYNKIAHLQSMQTLKSNFEITAKTVGDFFSTKGSDYAATASSITVAAAADAAAAKAVKDNARIPAGSTASAAAPTPKVATAKTTSSSFTQAFNLWNEQAKKHGTAQVADIVEFVIDPDIAKADIVDPLTANPNRSAGQTTAGTTPSGSQTNRPQGTAQNEGGNFTTKNSVINAGTTITKIINDVIINSKFIRSQLKEPETSSTAQPNKNTAADANSLLKASGSASVKWFKITNKIELLAYDDLRGGYGKKVTFFINKYDHYQSSFPGAPKGQPTGAVKNYNYIYTGKNRDIIDFEIKFDALFVNVIAIDKNKTAATIANPQTGSGDKTQANRENVPAYNIAPVQFVNTSGTQASLTGGSDETAEKQQAANFAENIYSSAGGDMIELKMKIIGDPHFIKQDEILFSPDKSMNAKGQWVDKEGGSLSMDRGEIYCNINFKSPVDIDETTGLLRKDSKWKDVYFSGLYKVNTVESEFRQGKFLQTINGFRIKGQSGDAKGPQTSTSATAGRPAVAGNPATAKDGGIGSTRGAESNTVTQVANLTNGESDSIITNNETGARYRRTADGSTEEIPNGQAPDRPGSDPLQQAARDNAATVDDYKNAGMSSAPAGLPLPDELGADPNQAALRNVAQNGPTGTIDANSADTGEPIVGAPSASTQVAAPPQPAPVVNAPVADPVAATPAPAPVTQAPPVQTAPQPAPATAAQRQSTAATAQLDALVAQSGDLAKQYAALQVDYQPQLAKLQALSAEYDKIVKLKSQAENNPDQLAQLEVERARLYAASAEQRATMTSTRNELVRLSRANDDIGKQIAAIKANTTNEDAELNALTDAADARQRATTKF
jgi:hypothetical protein